MSKQEFSEEDRKILNDLNDPELAGCDSGCLKLIFILVVLGFLVKAAFEMFP